MYTHGDTDRPMVVQVLPPEILEGATVLAKGFVGGVRRAAFEKSTEPDGGIAPEHVDAGTIQVWPTDQDWAGIPNRDLVLLLQVELVWDDGRRHTLKPFLFMVKARLGE